MPVPTSPSPLRPSLLRESVHDRLRAAIVDGTLAPGEVVRDTELAAWLGVSRTPVREALLRLGDTGLVRSAPGRSTVVAEIDHHPAYDPEIDHRVLWAREVLHSARNNPQPGRIPRASADLEGMAMFLLKKGPFAPGAGALDGDPDDENVMFPR